MLISVRFDCTSASGHPARWPWCTLQWGQFSRMAVLSLQFQRIDPRVNQDSVDAVLAGIIGVGGRGFDLGKVSLGGFRRLVAVSCLYQSIGLGLAHGGHVADHV